MITVGLDFGTHQSKVCVETQEGAELSYDFVMFPDCNGKLQYTLPSIILADSNGCLQYGYIPKESKGRIIRYFKQGAFTKSKQVTHDEAIYYSIWYLAYMLFELEKIYHKDFSIQMGVPTDGSHFSKQKQLAVRILLSAYHLVEDVFNNDEGLFLQTPVKKLYRETTLLPYSEEMKTDFGIQVIPEAHACLMPLIHHAKISDGMSLMVDIGGGTTDISFFTIDSQQSPSEALHVYDFYSINKGLNFLSDADYLSEGRLDSNIDKSGIDIKPEREQDLYQEINQVRAILIGKLRSELHRQSKIPQHILMRILESRPIIYTGGGSTFQRLRRAYGGFNDIIHISRNEWRGESVKGIENISALGLCPILSTAYGLSIHMADDEVQSEPFTELFRNVRCYEPEPNRINHYEGEEKTSVYADWDTIK